MFIKKFNVLGWSNGERLYFRHPKAKIESALFFICQAIFC